MSNTAPTGLTASGIAGMFTQLFARRKAETALDLRSLLKRRIEGEDVPDDHIIQAAADVGLDGPAVDKMAQRIALRRAHRAMAAERPGIEKELENVSRQIKALEDEWTEFRSSYITKLTPLAEKKQEIEARLGNANAAADAILDLSSLEPELAERLRAHARSEGCSRSRRSRPRASSTAPAKSRIG